MNNPLQTQYNERLQAQRIDILKEANPLLYNSEKCKQILTRTNKIELPRLNKEEMTILKEHLTGFKTIKKEELQYTFLNLRNAFLIIQEFEDNNQTKDKIRPIIHYLEEYQYLFELINESQGMNEHPTLDKAMNILNFDINKFCMRYDHLLSNTDSDTIRFNTEPITLDQNDTENPTGDEE